MLLLWCWCRDASYTCLGINFPDEGLSCQANALKSCAYLTQLTSHTDCSPAWRCSCASGRGTGHPGGFAAMRRDEWLILSTWIVAFLTSERNSEGSPCRSDTCTLTSSAQLHTAATAWRSPAAGGLSDEQMLRVTQELRHFESVFLEPTASPFVVRARVLDLSRSCRLPAIRLLVLPPCSIALPAWSALRRGGSSCRARR